MAPLAAQPALPPASSPLRRLRDEGWCLLRDAIPAEVIGWLDAQLAPDFVATPFCRGGFYGERTKRFGGLLARSRCTAALVENAAVLSVVEAVLGPWCDTVQLNLTQAIEIHPGALPQMPHRDQDMWQGPKGAIEYLVNVIWPLVPFTPDNGATVIHPRSHGIHALSEEEPGRGVAAVCAPGSALLFLGSTLHGGGGNVTAMPRRAIIISYCLGWLKPYENQWLVYPPAVARTFSRSLAALVGYRQHRPNLGNVEGLCPSLLLEPAPGPPRGASDALRPDQEAAVAAYVTRQRAGQADLHASWPDERRADV